MNNKVVLISNGRYLLYPSSFSINSFGAGAVASIHIDREEAIEIAEAILTIEALEYVNSLPEMIAKVPHYCEECDCEGYNG